MEPEENQQGEQNFIKKAEGKLKDANRKANKTKNAVKFFIKLPMPAKIAIIAIIAIPIIIVLFAGFLGVIDNWDWNTAKTAKQEALGAGSGYSASVVTLNKSNGTWDVSVNDELKNKLTDAGIDTEGMSQDELLKQLLMLYGISDQDFSDEELELMPILLKAEIATQYVDLRKRDEMYDSTNNEYITLTDSQIEEAKENDQILGTIHLKRVNTSDLSNPIILEYIDYEEFKQIIKKDNPTEDDYKNIRGNFSINDEGKVVIATWNYNKTTYNLMDGYIKNPYTESEFENSENYILSEMTVDYEPLVNKYTLPFEVLTALLINSEDVEFVKKVANLAFNSNIEITIAEEMTKTNKTYITNYYETVRNYQYIQMCTLIEGNKNVAEDYKFLEGDNSCDDKNDNIEDSDELNKTSRIVLPNNKWNCTYKDINFTNENPSYSVEQKIEIKDNTYKYGITYADTWFIKIEKNVSAKEIPENLQEQGSKIENEYKYSEINETSRANIPNNVKNDYLEEYYKNNNQRIKESAEETIKSQENTQDYPIISTIKGNSNKIKIEYSKKIPKIIDSNGKSLGTTPPITENGLFVIYVSNVSGDTLTLIDEDKNEFIYTNTNKGWQHKEDTKDIEVDYNQTTIKYKRTDNQTEITADSEKTKYELQEEESKQTIYDKKDEKFLKAYDESSKAKGNMSSTPGWLEEMIDEYNPNYTTIISYLLDTYYERNTSDYNIEDLLGLYNINNFQNLAYGFSSASIYNYMRAWECNALYKYYIGESKECANYVDGEYYKVYYGGSADPTFNIAYGIVISRSYNDSYFNQKGVSSDVLRSYQTDGEKFTQLTGKEIEDIFEQIIDKHKNAVESQTSGLNLSQNQKDALTAIKYQYGNIGNFRSAYEEYYLKGDIEGFKQNFKDSQGYQPLLDTSTNNKEGRISNRVKANLELFINNKYTDMNGNAISTAGGDASNAINFALTFVGKTGNELSSIMNFSYDWCAVFACYCYEKVGIIPSVIEQRYTYCPTLMNYAKSKGIWHDKSGYTPKTGDMILFDWNANAQPDHVGLVVSCDDSYVYTVEGNTGNEEWKYSQVKQKSYTINNSYILGYISPTK